MKSKSFVPDLIVCDIIMPVMDGYEFYQEIGKDETMSYIPFIFLSGKASIEDIRFGKSLGVDDYITKPFVEEDLLASIMGKLSHWKKMGDFVSKYEALISIDTKKNSSIPQKSFKTDIDDMKNSSYLFITKWDDILGPYVEHVVPKSSTLSQEVESVSEQLFNMSVAIYGYQEFTKSEDVLLKISNVNKDGFILFDALKGKEFRTGKSIFMLALISPRIHHLASERIREIFQDIAAQIKNGVSPQLEDYWDQIIYHLI
jgi:CheY-like chemotaxis protein